MAKLRFNVNQKQSIATSLTAAVAALLMLILLSLLTFILIKGSDFFWPQAVIKLEYQVPEQQGTKVVFAQEKARTIRVDQAMLHYGISDIEQPNSGQLTLLESRITGISIPQHAAQIQMLDGSTVLATVESLSSLVAPSLPMTQWQTLRDKVNGLELQISHLRQGELAEIHNRLAQMDKRDVDAQAPARLRLAKRFYQLQKMLAQLTDQLDSYTLKIGYADGQSDTLYLTDIHHIAMINQYSMVEKMWLALKNFYTFISESPKMDNTSGGVFPALFGTVLMVLLMTVFVTPFGVGAALYLHEYAPRNKFTSLIRVAVNNLAGVPSIVYGVFGLGLFVYALGGNIDSLFFEQDLPAPTFGSPGLFWASLTMAILTLPVVIVATEEGLRRVPVSLKQGSYALGATQAETMFNTVIPMASPGIMTGVILAIARGAGEVAPLLLVGAVKFAPALPIDGEFPFVHFQRQFMHLGVLIYDGAFHSQSVGNGSSFMFACCMMLLLIVMTLNLIAIKIRSRLRHLYSSEDF